MKAGSRKADTTYIIVLNWNGWHDTLQCLESLVALQAVNYRIVICDNGSQDGSREKIRAWARGEIRVEMPAHPRLQRLKNKAAGFPYPLLEISRKDVLSGSAPRAVEGLVLLDNAANLGFAGGCNSGIAYALAQPDMSHIWLLNNDTLVEPDSLANMLRRLERESCPAVCGSLLMFSDDPAVIQAIGGNQYNRWTGNASQSVGRYLPEAAAVDISEIEGRIDYLCGASMLLPRVFPEQLGLMDDSYFLYYEEIDWLSRARGQFKLCIAGDAIVYHKEGSSIGSASMNSESSALSDFYMFRNKLKYSFRRHPAFFPFAYLYTWLQALNRLRKGRISSAALIAGILLGAKTRP